MKNKEFYKGKIMKKTDNFCAEFIIPVILKDMDIDCTNITSCKQCRLICAMWLDEEYEEPEVDWSKVEVDTPILVSDLIEPCINVYFAKYENGKVWAWKHGKTSWTALPDEIDYWNHAKLAE